MTVDVSTAAETVVENVEKRREVVFCVSVMTLVEVKVEVCVIVEVTKVTGVVVDEVEVDTTEGALSRLRATCVEL